MQWFKHDTSAINDAKIKKLIIKHGAIGYAIYFHCLELIAGDISETNITFCLEHDSEIIADNLKIQGTAEKSGVQIVEEIMHYIVELDLFQEMNNYIYCFKLLKRLDSSMTSNQKFRKIITKAKENHDLIMTPSCKIRLDKNRIDKIRKDEIILDDDSFYKFWDLYDKKIDRHKCQSLWKKINPELHEQIYNHIVKYKIEKPDKQYRKNPSTYLNNRSWENEIISNNKKQESIYPTLNKR